MALAVERGNVFLPLPLNSMEERFLVEFIKEYVHFYEKGKINKITSKLFKKNTLHKLKEILEKVKRYDPFFEAAANIVSDLYTSLYGKHGHFNEERLKMYIRQLFFELVEIEKRLFVIQRI